MNFNSFAFNPQINAGITNAGYTSPTPIQSETIPAILDGKDILGLAQTGTGKTAAFVLPILQHLMKGPRGVLRALIVSPTRELAEQTHAFITQLGSKTGLRSLTVYGGVSSNPQIKGLRSGVDIVVACPGRLLDLKEQRAVNLSKIEILVLDEADHMFDMGFLPDIRRILKAVPEKRQTLLFSATMPEEIRKLATDILHDPVTVEIGMSKPLDTIRHVMYPVVPLHKEQVLLHLLRDCRRRTGAYFYPHQTPCQETGLPVNPSGISATSLQGNLSQPQREKAMNAFRSGHAKVMVATDIAARGIDVSQVSHVINYDVPDTADAYTHRTGRTGRMERLGTALSLVTLEDLPMVRTIERLMGQTLERRMFSQSGEGTEGTTTDILVSQPTQPTQGLRSGPMGRRNNFRFRPYAGKR